MSRSWMDQPDPPAGLFQPTTGPSGALSAKPRIKQLERKLAEADSIIEHITTLLAEAADVLCPQPIFLDPLPDRIEHAINRAENWRNTR